VARSILISGLAFAESGQRQKIGHHGRASEADTRYARFIALEIGSVILAAPSTRRVDIVLLARERPPDWVGQIEVNAGSISRSQSEELRIGDGVLIDSSARAYSASGALTLPPSSGVSLAFADSRRGGR